MKPATVVVIGAGIGGLTAAIHLSRQGFHVIVVEKNSQPGGRCGRLERDGFRFDTGPTLLVMPLLYEAEFRRLGVCMQEELDLVRVDPTYHLVFGDGSQLALTSDMSSLRRQLESREPGSFDALQRYLEEGKRHYELIVENFVERECRRTSECLRPRSLSLLRGLHALSHHYDRMARYFTDPRLKAAFTFQDIYVGMSPFEAPATYSLMPYTELLHGVWYPKGGMYSIVERLVELAEAAGVEFSFGTAAAQLEVGAGRVQGVHLENGTRLTVDAVLANADLPYVYGDLLPKDKRAGNLLRKRFSCSVISFFWALDRSYELPGPHTLFLADDYRQNFESIIRDQTLPQNPSVYLHAPTRLDPTMAPRAMDALTAIVPVGHLSRDAGQDWAEKRGVAREHVLRRLRTLGIHDIDSHIIFEAAYAPPDWQTRYNLAKGATHGLAHTLDQMAYFRPSNRHPDYRNLYFAGASTRPGTGVPTAMVSGRQAAERLLSEWIGA